MPFHSYSPEGEGSTGGGRPGQGTLSEGSRSKLLARNSNGPHSLIPHPDGCKSTKPEATSATATSAQEPETLLRAPKAKCPS